MARGKPCRPCLPCPSLLALPLAGEPWLQSLDLWRETGLDQSGFVIVSDLSEPLTLRRSRRSRRFRGRCSSRGHQDYTRTVYI
jgi:hypothetical protein